MAREGCAQGDGRKEMRKTSQWSPKTYTQDPPTGLWEAQRSKNCNYDSKSVKRRVRPGESRQKVFPIEKRQRKENRGHGRAGRSRVVRQNPQPQPQTLGVTPTLGTQYTTDPPTWLVYRKKVLEIQKRGVDSITERERPGTHPTPREQNTDRNTLKLDGREHGRSHRTSCPNQGHTSQTQVYKRERGKQRWVDGVRAAFEKRMSSAPDAKNRALDRSALNRFSSRPRTAQAHHPLT